MNVKTAIIKNSVEVDTQLITFGQFATMLTKGRIKSLPEFLQRVILAEEWAKNNNRAARSYIASLFRGTYKLDGFSIVPIELIKEKLEEAKKEGYSGGTNEKSLDTPYDEALKEVNEEIVNGVDYLFLDGQSRSLLAIKPYVENKIEGLGSKFSNDIDLYIDGKVDRSILAKTKYCDLPKPVQKLLNDQQLLLTIVTNFGQFSDVIDALVNKQKGWQWAIFQILKQVNRFSIFVISLIKVFASESGKTFTKLWNKKTVKLAPGFKFNRDGHQLFSILMAGLFDDGQWVNKKSIENKLEGTEKVVKTTYEKIFDYSTEIFKHRTDKTKISILINWNVFRWLLDGGKKSNTFYKRLGHTTQYSIVNVKSLLEEFITHHIEIKSKPHPLSWLKDSDGKWVRIDQGYAHALENQSTKSIESRMTDFIKGFPFDKCIEKGIIVESCKLEEDKGVIAHHHGGNDVGGKKVEILNLDSYHRGHGISKKNGGSNKLENVGLEIAKENLSHGRKNIVFKK